MAENRAEADRHPADCLYTSFKAMIHGFKATAQHTEYQRITRTVSVKSTFRATEKALPSHRKGSMSA